MEKVLAIINQMYKDYPFVEKERFDQLFLHKLNELCKDEIRSLNLSAVYREMVRIQEDFSQFSAQEIISVVVKNLHEIQHDISSFKPKRKLVAVHFEPLYVGSPESRCSTVKHLRTQFLGETYSDCRPYEVIRHNFRQSLYPIFYVKSKYC